MNFVLRGEYQSLFRGLTAMRNLLNKVLFAFGVSSSYHSYNSLAGGGLGD
jgi:hypothetical protein